MLENDDKYLIKKLDWDTKMFKIDSAKIILKTEIRKTDLEKIKRIVKEKQYKFITIENQNNNEKNNILIKDLRNIFLADVNIQFKKENLTINNYYKDKNIKINNNFEKNNNIIEISKNSFVYSRFINDENLNSNKYKVYENWTKNAFENKDKYFCYYRNNSKVYGYILFSINNELNEIIIELIAIDNNNENNGIGSKLLKELEKFAIDNDLKIIKVGTQLNNLKAQNFYEKNGFKHVQNNSIYHWWI